MKTLIDRLLWEMPFAAPLDLTVIEASEGRVVAATRWTPERCTRGGVLHGGFLMAVADSVGTACATLCVTAGSRLTPIDSTTTFVRSVREGDITITASASQPSPMTLVVQTAITRCDGRLVARIIQTLAVAA
jgi:1,4-dihydroxy-2-naphthoyl-CoA hydrolase